MLCEKCQQREATCHVTSITCRDGDAPTTTDDTPTTTNLCSECFEASSPQAHEMEAAWRAGCCYCGGEPVSSSVDLSAAASGEHKYSALCGPCKREYSRLFELKFPGMATFSMTPEQMANLQSANIPALFEEMHE